MSCSTWRPTVRSDIYTATAMSNDAAAALRKAVQKLWQVAMSQHQDRFVVHCLTHAATLVTSEIEVAPSLARRVVGATSTPPSRYSSQPSSPVEVLAR
jgi:hypothetical protein